jgi:hypothetical protein
MSVPAGRCRDGSLRKLPLGNDLTARDMLHLVSAMRNPKPLIGRPDRVIGCLPDVRIMIWAEKISMNATFKRTFSSGFALLGLMGMLAGCGRPAETGTAPAAATPTATPAAAPAAPPATTPAPTPATTQP